jgi:hypothetical protein
MLLIRAGSTALVMMFMGLGLLASSPEELTQITRNINTVFKGYYAPKQWKENTFGWNLETRISSVAAAAEQGNLEDFHRSLKDLFLSTRDYHTAIRFAVNSRSTLPISIKYLEGNFYLAYVAPYLANTFPLKPGDKITHINEQEIKELAWSLIGRIENPSLTDWALAARKLTRRSGAAGDKIETGSAIIKGDRAEKNVIAQIVWNVSENLNSNSLSINAKQRGQFMKRLPRTLSNHQKIVLENTYKHIHDRSFKVPFVDFTSLSSSEDAKDPNALGKKESFLPPLGDRVIWSTEASNPWSAYIYINADNKLIGVIRIPNYVPDETVGTPLHYATQFGEILAKMNEMTDLLVIDQLNNPGGSVFYLYTLASMLTDVPLQTPRHRFTIDSRDVWEAKEFLKQVDALIELASQANGSVGEVEAYPIDVQFLQHMKSYYQFIVEQWNAGKTLTDPYFLFGVDYIQPHPKYRYLKKIVLLTNEFDFSGGDFFPAIIQDNGRAPIVGTTTAGAGGYVLSNTDRNRAGLVMYSYTGSIAFRKDGNPLENLGVSPDIEYPFAPEDLALDYLIYRKLIEMVIHEMLK